MTPHSPQICSISSFLSRDSTAKYPAETYKPFQNILICNFPVYNRRHNQSFLEDGIVDSGEPVCTISIIRKIMSKWWTMIYSLINWQQPTECDEERVTDIQQTLMAGLHIISWNNIIVGWIENNEYNVIFLKTLYWFWFNLAKLSQSLNSNGKVQQKQNSQPAYKLILTKLGI